MNLNLKMNMHNSPREDAGASHTWGNGKGGLHVACWAMVHFRPVVEQYICMSI